MVELTNQLTTEERLSLTRVLDHDMTHILANIWGAKSMGNVSNETAANLNTFANFYRTLKILTQIDQIGIYKNCGQYPTNRFVENISNATSTIDYPFCLELQSQYSKIPTCEQDFTQAILNSLVKNSVSAGAELVRINIEPSGFPETATFIPEGARDYKDFVAFGFASKLSI